MKFLLVCLLSLFAPLVIAGEPIQDVGAFEIQFTDCMLKLSKDSRCMSKVAGKHVIPGGEKQILPVASQLDDFALKWLDKQKVFAVHPVSQKKTGDLFQVNTYLIEDDSGALMVFNYSIMKKLGKWYVSAIGLNSNSDTLDSVLKGK